MNNIQFNERLDLILKEYIGLLKNELREIWNNWELDLTQNEIYEVLGGLLSRQVTLTNSFIESKVNWTNDIAPIFLRTMADNYINFAWIIEKPLERAQKFIIHGLGQEKLMVEHRKAELQKQGIDPEKDDLIKASEIWISMQRYTFLTEVNLGSWSGLKTRQMAEEAGCIDFYNYVYQPFSTVVHNTWGHIAKYNLITSENELHRFLKKPLITEIEPLLHYLDLAVKYMSKMLCKFDEKYKHAENRESSTQYFTFEMKNLFDELDKENRST